MIPKEAMRALVAGMPWDDVGFLLGAVVGRIVTEVGRDDARVLVALCVDTILAVADALEAKA